MRSSRKRAPLSDVSQIPASEQSGGQELHQAVVFFLQPLIFKVTTHLVWGDLAPCLSPCMWAQYLSTWLPENGTWVLWAVACLGNSLNKTTRSLVYAWLSSAPCSSIEQSKESLLPATRGILWSQQAVFTRSTTTPYICSVGQKAQKLTLMVVKFWNELW